MLVRVYLDKGRVSDTQEYAETVISETAWQHYKNYKQTTNNIYLSHTCIIQIPSVAPVSSQEEHLLGSSSW